MSDIRRFFLRQFEYLPKYQRARKIHMLDVIEAAMSFGVALAVQLERDRFSGFKCWDSFSMICQSEHLLRSEAEVEKFIKWGTEQLKKTWSTE